MSEGGLEMLLKRTVSIINQFRVAFYSAVNGYHTESITYNGRMRHIFGNLLPKINDGLILDLGCCTGDSSEELARDYPTCKLIGIDINPSSISSAKSKSSNVEYVIGDGFKLTFKEKFEAIFCNNNLYYELSNMTTEQIVGRFGQIARNLKEGGYLIISGESESNIKGTMFNSHTDFIILRYRGLKFEAIEVNFQNSPSSKKIIKKIQDFIDSQPHYLTIGIR